MHPNSVVATSDLSDTLLIFPCCGRKQSVQLPRVLEPRSVLEALSDAGRSTLQRARKAAREHPALEFDFKSELKPAMNWYTGNPYEVPGFRQAILEALDAGCHCLIVSAGYGLLRPEERINRYQAKISDTLSIWNSCLPAVLDDYIYSNGISRLFGAFSRNYLRALRGREWGTRDVNQYWYVPVATRGRSPVVEVPMLVGEGLVSLIANKFEIDSRWTNCLVHLLE